MEKYLVPDYTDVPEFLAHLGKRLGKLKKGTQNNENIIVYYCFNCHWFNNLTMQVN